VSLRKPSGADLVHAIMSLMYFNSCGRNRYAFKALSRRAGEIDYGYMQQVYRRSGILPPGSFEEIARGYKENGEWGEVTTGHAGNAIVAFMKPSEGRYAVCVGPAARGLSAHAPFPHAGPVYAESNAFWEIRLADSPAGVMQSAAEEAGRRLARAEALRESAGAPAPAGMQDLIDEARREYRRGLQQCSEAEGLNGAEALYRVSSATRRFNQAQVLASQAVQMAVPEPRLPADLGM
jgi:hypothetical protein